MVDVGAASIIGGAIFGFTSGAMGSIANDLVRGNNVDWVAAAGWGLGGAISGAITGGLMPAVSEAGTCALLDTVFINAYMGSTVGSLVGWTVGGAQDIRDKINDSQYAKMKDKIQEATSNSITASDLDFASWLYDE